MTEATDLFTGYKMNFIVWIYRQDSTTKSRTCNKDKRTYKICGSCGPSDKLRGEQRSSKGGIMIKNKSFCEILNKGAKDRGPPLYEM